MNNSKLINVLRTFSKNEMKEFEKFISSAYFNKGRSYLPFLSILKNFYPGFNDEKMTQKYIYSKIYPGKEFNKQIVWNLSSGMLKLTEEFLIHNSLRKNKYARNQALAEEYHGRRLSRYFTKTIDEMESELDHAGIDDNYFEFKTRIEILRKAYHFQEDTQHLVPKHVAKKGEYEILNFLRSISTTLNDIDSNVRMFNANFDINLPYVFIRNVNLEEILRYARSKKFSYTWLIEMCSCTIMMLTQQDSLKYYSRLKELFKSHMNKFNKSESEAWLTALANYCVIKFDSDENYFRRELFELNKFHLKENFLPDDRYLSKILFVQILRNALSLNETQWARNFIEKYSHRLKPAYQKSMRALGLAYLNFNLKNFETVVENLKNVKFIDSRDKLNVRNLYIRTYYELNEIEAVISQIDSTKHFLSNNPLFTIRTKTNFIKSLNLLNRLINANLKKDSLEIESIMKTVEENKTLVLGKWIKQKIEELKGRG